MSQSGETFFTAVGCMDGRVQDVIARFGQAKFGVKFPDTITEAGIVGLLAQDGVSQALLDGIKFKVVTVSIGMHHSKGVIVHGHAECAGNPVPDERHFEDIRKAVTVMKDMVGSGVPVVGIFVKRTENGWEAEELV